MKITPIRSIENNKFKTILKPSEFGTASATETSELEMLKDFPQKLRYSDITFASKFVITDGVPTISTEVDAVEVKIQNLTNKEFIIDENLCIEMEFDANKISISETDATVFTNTKLLAQAKIILFEKMVLDKIKDLMNSARANVNNFEVVTEQVL